MFSPTNPAGSFSPEMGLALSVRSISWQEEDTLEKFRDMVSIQVCCTLAILWAC